METSLPKFSRAAQKILVAKIWGAAAPLAPPARTPMPLAKFQARIFLFKYLPKETLIHNARLIPIWNKSAEFKLSADSKHFESYFGRKHRNVWFRTLSPKAIHVFPAQFLLN